MTQSYVCFALSLNILPFDMATWVCYATLSIEWLTGEFVCSFAKANRMAFERSCLPFREVESNGP